MAILLDLWETVSMPKRALRVVKSDGLIPIMAVCTSCNRQFNVPPELQNLVDAKALLEVSFTEHKCKFLDSSQNALRVVREATENK
jgi:hypothetical protein